jgi:hypothetical protein
MDNEFFEGYKWSKWYRLGDEAAKEDIPEKPGIYEIRADFEFGRLKGKSQIIYVGRATKQSLQNRLAKGKLKNLVKNLDRPDKWLYDAKQTILFRYIDTDTKDEAKYLEALCQWKYENEHWELPPGNDRLEKDAIFKIIKQKYSDFNKTDLENPAKQNQTINEIAKIPCIPSYVIENLKVYYLI